LSFENLGRKPDAQGAGSMFKATTGAIISTLVVVSVFYLPLIDICSSFYLTPLLSAIDSPGIIDAWLVFSFSLFVFWGLITSFIVISVGRRNLKGLEVLPPVLIPGLGVGSLSIVINGNNPTLTGAYLSALAIPLIVVIFMDYKKQGDALC
jgi:hypothetical protein